MPFQQSQTEEAYILDEDLVIDSETDKQETETNTDFTVTLPKVLNNVLSLDVTQVEINQETIGIFSVLKWIDIRVTMLDTATGDLHYHDLAVKLPPFNGVSTVDEIMQFISTNFNLAVRAEFTDGDKLLAEYFGGNLMIKETLSSRNNPSLPKTFGFYLAGYEIHNITLLFLSGAHAESSIAPLLGFDKTDLDATLVPTYHFEWTLDPASVLTSPYTYVDIFIREAPELRPFFRYYPDYEGFSRRQLLPGRSRMLTAPLRRLEKLHFQVRLRGGLVPTDAPLFLHLRILHLNESTEVPQYLKERIVIK